jgi:CubicO group peptidase (beta-lactamase class C family)
MMQRRDFISTSASAIFSSSAVAGAYAQSKRSKTMTAPFSATGLERLHEVMARAIKPGTPPGLVLLVAKGDAVHVDSIGAKSIGGTPMRRDSIFRITSMTKPITAAAAMMLVEDGKLALDEPAERLLPELANRQVLTSLDAPPSRTVPAERPIIVRDLMNFTLGFGLQFDPNLPIQKRIDELALVNGPPVPQTPHLPDEWMKRFGTLPLMHQPGATWNYNTGSLILGVLIACASGQPLGEFMKARIFEPLGITDTAFFVPEAKRDRFVSAYNFNFRTGESFLEDKPDGQWSAPPPFPSGAAGLVSTVDRAFSINPAGVLACGCSRTTPAQRPAAMAGTAGSARPGPMTRTWGSSAS